MNFEFFHQPVLLKEVIDYLNPKPGQKFIDATFDGGGHGIAILNLILPKGKLLGIELDSQLLEEFKIRKFKKEFENNLVLANGSYVNLKKIAKENGFLEADGILFDLGFSSWHLNFSGRGFSFLKDEPLDMRFDLFQTLTAREILNSWPKNDLIKILKEFGEERFALRIAENIVKKRKIKRIERTTELVNIIKESVPNWYKHRKIHFATKTFQALRISVNNELGNLKKALQEALDVVKIKGRILLISFHSLEDRIIKQTFKNWHDNNLVKILTKKPVKPTKGEINKNPRARSAKLRAAIKI